MRKSVLSFIALAGMCFAAYATPILRVMPLGDSITNGSGSNDTAGYRGFLWTFLKNAGYDVDFVGSATSNPGTIEGMDINHEGHGGWKIDDRYNSNEKGIYEMLPTWCGTFEAPNVILLHLGTNDSGNDALTNMWRTTEFLDRLHQFEPSAHVIATTLMWRKTEANYARIQNYNSYLTNVVQQQQAKGQKISILDMHAAVPGDDKLEEGQTTYFGDGLHPNAAGYELMANAWLGAIQELYPDPTDFDNATTATVVNVTAEAAANQMIVTVSFNKSMNAADITNAANYAVSGATLGTPVPVALSAQSVQFFYSGDHRGKTFTLTVSGVRAADDGQAVASRSFELTIPAAVDPGPENHVPMSEFSQYRLIYDLNVPTNLGHKGWYAQAVPYAIDNSKTLAKGGFTRVAYWFETVRADNGQHDWVWVSLDAFTDDPGAIGVPTHRTGKWFQKKVTNLRIWSNSTSLTHRNGELVDEGNMEFWPMSYSGGQKMNLPNTLGGFDFDDTPSTSFNANYGSMQIHDYKARNVVFGINHFESGGRMEMGVGTNNQGGNADWTQVNKPYNTFVDGSCRLKVYVMDDTEDATPPEFLSAATRQAGTQLVLTFSKPLAAAQDFMSGLTVDGAEATRASLDPNDPARVVVQLAKATTNAVTVTAAGLRDNTPRANAMASAQTCAVEGTDLPPEVVKYVPAALREGYDLVYALDIPVEGFRNGVIPYSVARRDYPAAYDRVAYFMEIDASNAFTTNWVWTSFDAWTGEVGKIAVPFVLNNVTNSFDGTFVSNLDVASNVNGIQTGTNLTGGYIEFWYENYGGGNAFNVPNADGTKCDFGDSRGTSGSFGSMQVHNYEARQTLWAFNKFNNYNSWINIGIGNNTTGTGHPDWTCTDAKDFAIVNTRRRTLYVMVRRKAPSSVPEPVVPAPQTILSNVEEAKDYSLLYKVNIPAAAKNLNNNLANWLAVHEVNNQSLYAGKTFSRVAYYLELVRKSDGATQWAWTSYDAPTQDMDRLGFITNKLWNVKTRIRNLNVRSNVDGIVQGDGIQTGSIEFFGSSYGRAATQGLPGADATVATFDWDDTEQTGTWGCLQVANYGAQQMILSVTGHMTGNTPSLGIGNCATAANLDWTQKNNAGDFTARTLYVFVQEGNEPASAPIPFCETLYVIPEMGGRRFCVAFDKAVPDSMLDPVYYVFTGVSAEVARVERSPRDEREAIVTIKEPLAAGATGWLTVQIPGSSNMSPTVPKVPAFTVPDGATPPELDAVTEKGGFQLVYKFTPATSASWVGTIGPAYAVDETRFRDFEFDRVAYALRIRTSDGKTNQWVWASMDPFTDDVTKLGIACERRQNTWQCYVDNLYVQHGWSGVMEPILTDGTYPRGNIEFFMGNYGGANAINIPGANGSVNDFGDSNSNPTTGYTYNSLQVHSYMAGQTVLAVNSLGGGYNTNGNGAKMTANPGVGIGNNVANTHTDWTFIYNASQYETRDLYVFVRPVARAGAVTFTKQPEGGAGTIGTPFFLTAYSPTAVRYQWRKNGVAIPGAIDATFDALATRKETATYDVIAYDDLGNAATSSSATVVFKSGGTHIFLR